MSYGIFCPLVKDTQKEKTIFALSGDTIHPSPPIWSSDMSTIPDIEILNQMKSGKLVKGGEDKCVGPACYELRMGEVYYDLTENNKRIEVKSGENILIKPSHRVVLITFEQVEIPDNMIGHIISKGSLFSVGLSPACTYADPGFSGNLGIVTQNIGDKYIQIPFLEPIAKIDFSYLSGSVQKPYQGQHGYKTEIWPIKMHLQKAYEEVKDDKRVDSEENEAYKILPNATAKTLRIMQKNQRKVDWAIFGSVILNCLILVFVTNDPSQWVLALVINLVSSCIIWWFSKAARLEE